MQRKKSKTTSRKKLWLMLKEGEYLRQAKKFLNRYNSPVGIVASGEHSGVIVYGIQSIEFAPLSQSGTLTFSPVTELQSPSEEEKQLIFSKMDISPAMLKKFFGGAIIADGKIWKSKTDL